MGLGPFAASHSFVSCSWHTKNEDSASFGGGKGVGVKVGNVGVGEKNALQPRHPIGEGLCFKRTTSTMNKLVL